MARLEQCIVDAAGELGIDKRDAEEIADRLKRFRDERAVQNRLGTIDEDIRKFAADKAEEQRIAAAQRRKHAALNVIARRKADAYIDNLVSQGMSERKAISSMLVGSVQGMAGARKSVAARRIAIEAEWLEGLMREIKRDRPHLVKMIVKGDEALMEDVAREMWEIRPDGKRGLTGNKDAEFLAGLLSKYAEMSRLRLNDSGAFIGKLDGHIFQSHDADLLRKVKADEWIKEIKSRLDIERSFPNLSGKEIDEVLGEVYQNVITGRDRVVTAGQKGQRTSPANLAKSLGKHRVLHFKNADAWIDYNRQFGRGNPVTSTVAHLHMAARKASMMETLGPNPEVMLTSILESRQAAIRNNPDLDVTKKEELINDLDTNLDNPITSRIANAYAQVSGDTIAPAAITAAKISQGARSWISMAKLGAAVLTAVPTDTVAMAAQMRFQGKSLGAAWGSAFKAALRGRSVADRTEVSDMIETGFESVFGEITARYLADDMLPGTTANAVQTFFKLNGLTGWTERARSAFTTMSSMHMAQRAKSGHADLPDQYRHLLGLHGIGEVEWEAARKMTMTDERGKSFVIPEMARHLDDETIDTLIASDLVNVRSKLKGDALARREQQLRDQARRDLETTVNSFFADEARFGVLDTEDADRMISNAGAKPGTIIGEVVRFAMQLKGFPIAFTRKILGRAVSGGMLRREGYRLPRIKGGRLAMTEGRFFSRTDFGSVAELIASMTVAGYIAMTLKDLSKNRTPKSLSSPATWTAAMLQGGALGIYGDFFFGHANRFGNGPLETLAGPTGSEIATLVKNFQLLRDGESKAADWFRQAVGNIPYINLWYTRAALDYMVLKHIEEEMSPGITARRERNMREQFGQETLISP